MNPVSNAQSSPVVVLLNSVGLDCLCHHRKFSQTALFHRRVNQNESGDHLGSGYRAKSDSGGGGTGSMPLTSSPAAAALAALRL